MLKVVCFFQLGEELLVRKHENSPEIQARVNSLIQQWNELIKASTERGKGLEEAKDILKFNEEAEKIESWIRDKVTHQLHVLCHVLVKCQVYRFFVTNTFKEFSKHSL